MAQSKVEHLQRMLAVVHKIDRGSARANRTALRSSRDDGSIPLDLLATAPYERVVALLGPGDAPRRRVVTRRKDLVSFRHNFEQETPRHLQGCRGVLVVWVGWGLFAPGPAPADYQMSALV